MELLFVLAGSIFTGILVGAVLGVLACEKKSWRIKEQS